LAHSVSNYRYVMKNRMMTSPAMFKNQKWTQKNYSLRSRTIDHFHQQIINFDWNSKNQNIEDVCNLLFDREMILIYF